MARKRRKGSELSVFKGREARLNRAIFTWLAKTCSQTIYDIHRGIKTYRSLQQVHYGNVNKRVRALEQKGYITSTATLATRAGFGAKIYELAPRAYLALILDSISVERIIERVDKEITLDLLAVLARIAEKEFCTIL